MKLWKQLLTITSLLNIGIAQQVGVDAAGQSGSAVLRRLGSECYAITANHVVNGAGTVTLTDSFNRHATAFLKREYRDADLAILAIESQNKILCDQANWPASTADISNILQNAGAAGKLVKAAASGSAVAEIPVTVVNYSNGRVVINPSQTAIAKGWSGSGLYLSGRLVGILTDVDTSTGRGSAIRIDYVERIISDFFGGPPVADPFIRTVRSQEFDERIRAILALLTANKLERLRGDYVSGDEGPQDSSGTQTFSSTVQLPGFSQPGTLDFHNNAGYYKPTRLDKHPLRLDYTESFLQKLPSQELRKARFDALSAVIDTVVPSSWIRNSYSHGAEYDFRNQYEHNGMRIIITLHLYDLEIDFLPKE